MNLVIDEWFGDGLSISIEPVSSIATSASGKFARGLHSRTPKMARGR